jgi:hypothetical protein
MGIIKQFVVGYIPTYDVPIGKLQYPCRIVAAIIPTVTNCAFLLDIVPEGYKKHNL